MQWEQFILQLVVTLVPVALALINQNKKIAKLQSQNETLTKDNTSLKERLDQLQMEHNGLQARYEKNLTQQAGMRNRF